ncbi:MAG: hypothetical protein ABJ092_14510 [Gillisia sp.]
MYTITRIFTDENGDSHFENVFIPLKDEGEIGFLSDLIQVKGMVLREVLPSYDFDFHNTPHRQYIILLDGKIEIETSLGKKRQFSAGEILLMEDTTGKGHKTRNLIKQTRRSIFIKLD